MTSNNVEVFRTYRPAEGGPEDQLGGGVAWPIRTSGTEIQRGAPCAYCLPEAVNRGELAINGLRKRDLQSLPYDSLPQDPGESDVGPRRS